ncbi:MAG: hypothetical protein JSS29_00805 [Proteobacteria bacterium]|nr:hypothetical protein [Pseudomonadota bacterium]
MNTNEATAIRIRLIAALACLVPLGVQAQQNPLESLKDAFNKAKQQVQQAASSASSTTPAAAPAAGAAGTAGTAAPQASAPVAGGATPAFTPPPDAPAAPAGPLVPGKLMDIAGIHIGMPIAATVPILKALHPDAPPQPQTPGRDEPMSAYLVNWSAHHPPPSDTLWVNYTFDTTTVFGVFRAVGYEPQISKAALVEALRKKYGPETAALSFYDVPKSDTDITKMWWLSDESGKVLHPANLSSLSHVPYGCATQSGYGYDVTSAYRTAFRAVQDNKQAAATLCDSLVVLYVEFDNGSNAGHNDPSLVVNSRSTLIDNALFRRSTTAWANRLNTNSQAQQQQALQKAGQAKPNL